MTEKQNNVIDGTNLVVVVDDEDAGAKITDFLAIDLCLAEKFAEEEDVVEAPAEAAWLGTAVWIAEVVVAIALAFRLVAVCEMVVEVLVAVVVKVVVDVPVDVAVLVAVDSSTNAARIASATPGWSKACTFQKSHCNEYELPEQELIARLPSCGACARQRPPF